MQEAQPLLNFTKDAHSNQRLALGEFEPLEHVERLAHREAHILGDAAALHLHREALPLQTVAMAARALAQHPVWFEVPLDDPRSVFIATTQVGNDTLEVLPERVRAFAGLRPVPDGP